MYFKKGDHVILADNEETRTDHLESPGWYPAPGTRGVVTGDGAVPYVQWEKGSTSVDDLWSIDVRNLILEKEAEKYIRGNNKMEELALDELIEKNIDRREFYRGKFEYNGEKFVIGIYDRNDELCIWADNGLTSIGHYDNTKDKSTKELVDLIETDISNYLKGYIKCSDCGKLIKKTEVAGTYFAGSYCKDCWEGKWKAIEAKETYD